MATARSVFPDVELKFGAAVAESHPRHYEHDTW